MEIITFDDKKAFDMARLGFLGYWWRRITGTLVSRKKIRQCFENTTIEVGEHERAERFVDCYFEGVRIVMNHKGPQFRAFKNCFFCSDCEFVIDADGDADVFVDCPTPPSN